MIPVIFRHNTWHNIPVWMSHRSLCNTQGYQSYFCSLGNTVLPLWKYHAERLFIILLLFFLWQEVINKGFEFISLALIWFPLPIKFEAVGILILSCLFGWLVYTPFLLYNKLINVTLQSLGTSLNQVFVKLEQQIIHLIMDFLYQPALIKPYKFNFTN